MNLRQLLHVVQAVALALSGGTVVFVGVGAAVTQNIAVVASLVGIAVTAYLGWTTTGEAR